MRHIGSVQLGVVLDNTVIDIMIIGFIPKAEFFEKLMKAYTIKKDPDQVRAKGFVETFLTSLRTSMPSTHSRWTEQDVLST
jgi:uncharacterized membrane protein YecN with MAPEG domain